MSRSLSLLFTFLIGVCACSGGSPITPANVPSDASARIAGRTFPSIFQAWNPAQNLNAGPSGAIVPLSSLEPAEATIARHDLYWAGVQLYKLAWDGPSTGQATQFTAASIVNGLALRSRLLAANPHIVLLAEVRYHDAVEGYLPDDSPWWMRDSSGNRMVYSASSAGDGTHYYLDFSRADFQDQVARQCQALVETRVVDGCMLDWWSKETPDRITMIQTVRNAIGPNVLLMVNVNGSRPVASAPYVNGMYMEGLGASFFPDWTVAAGNIEWGQANLRSPAFTALDVWAIDQTSGRNNYSAMRFATALALIHGDGYALFADPNTLSTPDHLHDWYPFWTRSLGHPTAAGVTQADNSELRDYEQGSAILNPPTNSSVVIQFPVSRMRGSTMESGTTFTMAPGDADLFLQ